RHAAGAPLLEVLEDHLRVAARPELPPLGFQRGAQAHEVVDLAVVADDDGAVGALHRLDAAFHVDDRQPPVTDRDIPAAVGAIPDPLPVRAAVDDAGEHARQSLGIRLPLDEPRDAAHELGPGSLTRPLGIVPSGGL